MVHISCYSLLRYSVVCFIRVVGDEEPFAVETVAQWPYYRGKVETELEITENFKDTRIPELVCMRPSLLLGPGIS